MVQAPYSHIQMRSCQCCTWSQLHEEPMGWPGPSVTGFSLCESVFLTPSASGPLFISGSSHLPLSAHEDRVSILALGQHMYGQRQSSGKAIFCSLSSRKHCQFPAQEHRAEPELCLQRRGTEDQQLPPRLDTAAWLQCKHLLSRPSGSQ